MAETQTAHRESPPCILVVDDDDALRRLVIHGLRAEAPCHVEEAGSAAEARERLGRRPFDVVITDLAMPREGGLSLMQWAQEHRPGSAWIVLTGHGTLDAAVRALQLGAFDFLSKPLRNVAPLRNAVRNALERQRLLAERDRLLYEVEERNRSLREYVEQLEEACRLLRDHADTIRADLHRAALIQQALLPRTAPDLGSFSVHALYRPSQNVGGDLYDVVRLDERRAVLLIADAAGHGLAAAMLAVLFRNELSFVESCSRAPVRPCDALQAVNRSFSDRLAAPGLFLTAACCLLDLERRELSVASAGHPPLLLERRSGTIERVYHTGPALGLYPEASYAQRELRLEPGDRLLLHTDGVYEQIRGRPRDPSERLAAALERDDQPAAGLLDRLLRSLGRGRPLPEPPEDDVTLVLLDATPGPSSFDNGRPEPMLETPTARVSRGTQILLGEEDGRAVLSVQGRASWAQSASFHEACSAAIEARRRVVLDLALCSQLDSTFLGTIHELAEQAERADVELRLQGVLPAVENLFAELGMKRVLERIVAVTLPLPTQMRPLLAREPDARDEARRTLRAHEALAALNERNRREFDPLVSLLRQEAQAVTAPVAR